MASPTSVAAIVPSHNSGPLLDRCVRSLLADNSLLDAIFIVDSASTDEAARQAERLSPKVHVTYLRRDRGISYALNTGIRQALARPGVEYLLFLDDDAWIEPGTTAGLIAALEGVPRLGIATPMQCEYDGQQLEAVFARKLKPEWGVEAVPGSELKVIPVNDVIGAAMMIPRRVLDHLGWFDENFFLYGNDTDLCRRAVRAGYGLGAVDGLRAHHRHHFHAGSEPRFRQLMMGMRARLILHLKDHRLPPAGRLLEAAKTVWRNLRLAARKRSRTRALAILLAGAWIAWRWAPIWLANLGPGPARLAERTEATQP